jgi:hypothetical protein
MQRLRIRFAADATGILGRRAGSVKVSEARSWDVMVNVRVREGAPDAEAGRSGGVKAMVLAAWAGPFSKKLEKGRTHGFVLGSKIVGIKSGYTSATETWPTRPTQK